MQTTKKNIPIKIIKINSSTFQLTKISTTVLDKISEKFSWLPPGYKFQAKFRLMGVKGVKVRLIKSDGTFPAGLFSEVVQYITDELGKEIVMSNDVLEHFLPLHDLLGDDSIRDDVFSNFKIDGNDVFLRDYQLNGVKSAFENRNCLLNLSTGAGKCLGPDTILDIRLPDNLFKKYQHLLEK